MNQTTRIAIPGTFNFRDAGGYPAAGGRVRTGKLFRSDALSRLGEPGRQAVVELGIRTVIDLRDEFERTAMPDDTDGLGIANISLPVFEGSGASSSTLTSTLAELYATIVREHADVLVSAIRDVARSEGGVLVHCTAGKDRSGMVIALALRAVGVTAGDVVANYSESEQNLAGEWLEQMMVFIGQHGGEDTPALRVLLGGSPPEAMESVLGLIDTEWGGVREYLIASGMSELELVALRAALVESAI